MDTNRKVFRNKGLTPGAALGCTARVNFDIHPTSIFRFVLDALPKLSPGYITNTSIHTTPVTIHEFIIEPPAFIKLVLKQSSLMLGWMESVFKGFIHHPTLYLKEIKISTRKETAHSSPAMNCGAF